MFVYALRDLKRGEEVTVAYFNFMLPYEERKEKARRKWGFECGCRLCQLDGNDPKGEIERKKLMQKFEQELK